MQKIYAPFTPNQVKALNEFQVLGIVHPFTCGNDEFHSSRNFGVPDLVATEKGWVCPHPECGYKQNWAFKVMADIQALKDNWNAGPMGKINPLK